MQNTQNIFKDPIYQTGLILLLISALTYFLPAVLNYLPREHLSLFFFNYALATAYFFVLIANRKKITRERKLDYRFLLLIMLLVSAYSLNRDMNVFESSVSWLSVSLVASCINYIFYSVFFQAAKPRKTRFTYVRRFFICSFFLSVSLPAAADWYWHGRAYCIWNIHSYVRSGNVYSQYDLSYKKSCGN